MKNIIFLVCFGLLAACQTVEGMGRDIQAAGHAITGGAVDGRQQINR